MRLLRLRWPRLNKASVSINRSPSGFGALWKSSPPDCIWFHWFEAHCVLLHSSLICSSEPSTTSIKSSDKQKCISSVFWGGVRLNVSHLPKWTFQIVSTLPSIFLIILRRHTLPWINHTPNGIAALQLIPDQSCRTPSGNSLNSTHGTGAGLNPPSTNGESRKVPSEKLTVRTYCPHTRLHPSLSKHQSCWSKNVLPSTCRQ